MNKKKLFIKETLRNSIPNIPFFQKILAHYRLKAFSIYDDIEKTVISSARKDDQDFKKGIVDICSQNWPATAVKIRKTAESYLEKSAGFEGRSTDETLLTDILYTYFGLGFSVEEYVSYGFENRSVDERQEFLGDRQRIKHHFKLDNLIDSSVFTDKMRTYVKFQPYFKRTVLEIKTAKDYSNFKSFTDTHSEYVKKDVYGSYGRYVEHVDVVGCGKTVKEQFDEMIRNSKYVVEEVIHQSDLMAAVNESSVNTVRCITMMTREGINVPFGYFRIGKQGSFVDNTGSGGIVAGINMRNGVVETIGRDEYANSFELHPGSGVEFKGFQLPEWDQLLGIAREVASQVSGCKTIGWDFAHTDKGWVMVEGNAMSQIGVQQIPYQRGFRKDFERYFKEMEPIIKM